MFICLNSVCVYMSLNRIHMNIVVYVSSYMCVWILCMFSAVAVRLPILCVCLVLSSVSGDNCVCVPCVVICSW